WLLRLKEGEVRGRKTPVGIIPAKDELNLDGVTITQEDLETILSIDTARWKQEMKYREQHLEQFTGLPAENWQAHRRLAAALHDAGWSLGGGPLGAGRRAGRVSSADYGTAR